MHSRNFKLGRAPSLIIATGLVALAAAGTAAAVAAPRMHEITISILHLKAIDKIDLFSKGDFFARVTIGDDVRTTPVAKQQAELDPNWVVTLRVPAGKHDAKLELFDKDLTKDEPIDVNPVAGSRALTATIFTRRCRVMGEGRSYPCGQKITVAGTEPKSAEITFKVDVKR